MKNLKDIILLSIIFVLALIYAFRPTIEEIKIEKEYIKGDTTEIIKLRNELDSTNYVFDSFKDSIESVEPQKIYIKGKTRIDTFYKTKYIPVHWTYFNLGTDSLGTSGKVSYSQEQFSFSDINFRYPETIKTVTDTVKQMTTIEIAEPFYKNSWFYTTISTIAAFIFAITWGGA